MAIEITNETDYKFEESEFIQLALFAFKKMYLAKESDLNIRFVEPHIIAALHQEYLELPGPTDVMSFPMDELKPGTAEKPTLAGILGDIVICPEVAKEQAETAKHSFIDEMLLLTVHSILHLLGYDHAKPQEKKEMFDLQRAILLEYIANRNNQLQEK